MQRSAFFHAKVHLKGAETLVAELGGFQKTSRELNGTDFDRFFLSVLLTFAATTTPTDQLCDKKNYYVQLAVLLDTIAVDTSQTATPFPPVVLGYLSKVTELRAQKFKVGGGEELEKRVMEIIALLQAYDARKWSEDVAVRYAKVYEAAKKDAKDVVEGYTCLLEAMLAAIVL